MDTTLPTIKEQIEQHRLWWAEVAKENGWYKQPFYIQVWFDRDGEIEDSVSYQGMTRDYIINNF
jgi:hypothetical protein